MSKTFKEWRNGKPPSWITGETLARYVAWWNSLEFTTRSTRNQENRNTPIDTLGNVKHTSGSIPIAEHRERLISYRLGTNWCPSIPIGCISVHPQDADPRRCRADLGECVGGQCVQDYYGAVLFRFIFPDREYYRIQ